MAEIGQKMKTLDKKESKEDFFEDFTKIKECKEKVPLAWFLSGFL